MVWGGITCCHRLPGAHHDCEPISRVNQSPPQPSTPPFIHVCAQAWMRHLRPHTQSSPPIRDPSLSQILALSPAPCPVHSKASLRSDIRHGCLEKTHVRPVSVFVLLLLLLLLLLTMDAPPRGPMVHHSQQKRSTDEKQAASLPHLHHRLVPKTSAQHLRTVDQDCLQRTETTNNTTTNNS